MKKVLVTGASGFIGKNLCAELEQNADLDVIRFDRTGNEEELAQHVDAADFIFHLAGVNRPKDDSEFKRGNEELTSQIISQLEKKGKQTPVLLTSSIQADLDNPYGVSKKAAEDIVMKYGKTANANVFIYRLPNVFGKWCKPNYNSVVATFCHNITHNLPITVSDPSHKITLAYIDDVVSQFVAALHDKVTPEADGFCYIPETNEMTLQELKDIITIFRESRTNLTMPDLASSHMRNLYATFTSYFSTEDFSYELQTSTDDRGWLAEFIKSKNFGQIFISKTKPGITRGNHWHNTKIEKFLVVDGKAEITFRKVDEETVIRYEVSGEKLTVLDIPAGYVHAIKNIGDTELTTIFWADEILNKDKPDTIFVEV